MFTSKERNSIKNNHHLYNYPSFSFKKGHLTLKRYEGCSLQPKGYLFSSQTYMMETLFFVLIFSPCWWLFENITRSQVSSDVGGGRGWNGGWSLCPKSVGAFCYISTLRGWGEDEIPMQLTHRSSTENYQGLLLF